VYSGIGVKYLIKVNLLTNGGEFKSRIIEIKNSLKLNSKPSAKLSYIFIIKYIKL